MKGMAFSELVQERLQVLEQGEITKKKRLLE